MVVGSLLVTAILVVTESAAAPRQLRLLNGVLAALLCRAVLKVACNTVDNTHPTCWTVACIALFAPQAPRSQVSGCTLPTEPTAHVMS